MRSDDLSPRADPIVTGTHPLEPGQSIWRRRGIADWLLKFTTAGQARFGFDDESGEAVTSVGEIALVKPHARHDYGTIGATTWRMIWAVFDAPASWAELLDWPDAGPGVKWLRIADAEVRERVSANLHEMHRFATAGGSQRKYLRLAMNSLEAALLWCDFARSEAGDDAMDPRLRRAVQHIHTHLGSRLDSQSLCEVSGLSIAQLARLFSRRFAMTPQAFVERERMARAKQLLEHTALTVQGVAWEVGFESPFYFTRRFRIHNAISPSAYRERVRPGGDQRSVSAR